METAITGPARRDTSRRRLLLVEDNPADADLLAEYFLDVEERSPEIELAETLEAALELLTDDHDFAAVLLDLGLPDSSGLDTLGRVLAQNPFMPVIVMTGADDEGLGSEAVARGAADFLPKGELSGQLLLRSIQYAIERGRRRTVQAQYRALVENSRDLVSILEPDLTIRYVSPSIRRVLGYRPEEREGVDATEQVHPEDRERVQREVERLLAEPDYTSHFQYRVQHKDGSWRRLDTIAQNCFDDPSIGGFVVSSRDVTEISALEDRLRQATKMEAVGRLAAGVAHDFNNLLTAVEGHASFLLQELEDPELREGVEEIRYAGRRAASLTRQLLTFSRKQKLEERRVDLGRAATELDAMLRRLVPERIELAVEVRSEDIVVKIDVGQLQQILMNLVVNAVDAIDESGTVTIVIDTTRVTPEQAADIPWRAEPGEYARLTVRDTGSGMTDEIMSHVYEPFYTTKEEGEGTGLGLATVYGIVKQGGGHIFAKSTLEEGTSFEVLLPRLREGLAGPSETETAVTMPTVDGVVVLLVEDDPPVRKIARKILTRAGFTVLEASSGTEALELTGRHRGPIDVVLSDVVMPDMGGLELHKELKARHPELRFVLTSGYSESEAQEEIQRLDVEFVAKPFTPDKLVRTVAKVVETKQRG